VAVGPTAADTLPFHYIRDKTTDQLMVQTRKVNMLGERASCQYQELKLPGAGVMKVNLANGNMHYEMDDASLPARRYHDWSYPALVDIPDRTERQSQPV
jgi:hypothetical protein